jgi:hypothetical protein
MPNTYVAIATVTVGAGGASTIEFTSIPQTYTDLLVKISARGNPSYVNSSFFIEPNGLTTSKTARRLYGNGSSASTDTNEYIEGNGSISTALVFANLEIYIPNYTSSNYKSISIDNVTENNATLAYTFFISILWSNTSAITSLTFNPYSTDIFNQYSTATLYGIKNS